MMRDKWRALTDLLESTKGLVLMLNKKFERILYQTFIGCAILMMMITIFHLSYKIVNTQLLQQERQRWTITH